jgi:hypothetical protein
MGGDIGEVGLIGGENLLIVIDGPNYTKAALHKTQ